MFKNMIVYRISEAWQADWAQLDEALAKQQFEECGATQEKSVGWVPPRGEDNGAMVESVGGQWMLRLMSESKMLPASVLNRKLNDKLAQIEAKEGRKPGKKEKQELKDECKLDLLPMAFTKQGGLWVWIDPQARLLVLDTGSQGRADEVVTMLVEASPGFAVALIDTQTSPQAAMAGWLHSHEAPAGFSIDRECELKSADESKAVVRYARHPLDIDEIREHIDQGKLPTKLAMTWDDRVSFVLTEGLQLKKVALLDVVMEGQNQDDAGFDADVAIATGEFSQLIPELIEALGGEGRTELGQLPDRGQGAGHAPGSASGGAVAAAKAVGQGSAAAPAKNASEGDFARRAASGGAHTGPRQAPVDEDPATAPF